MRNPRFYRLILGAVVLACLWALFAWSASGQVQASILAAGWTLIVAPAFFPPLIWLVFRMKGRLHRESLGESKGVSLQLRDLVLHCVLHRAHLDIDIWILEEDSDVGFFWYERFSTLRRHSKTKIILSRAWLEYLEKHPKEATQEFKSFWDKIASYSVEARRLRTLQMRFWMGGLFWAEVLLRVLDLLLGFAGVRRLPASTFWCQGLAWKLNSLWFGSRSIEEADMKISQHALRVEREPLYWNSLLLGVWSYYPSRVLHPSWRLLTRDDSLLYS